MKYSITEIVNTIKGHWQEATAELMIDGYSIDSRTLQKNDLFFAFKGESLDGHDYVENAIAAGASAAIVNSGFTRDYGSTKQLIPVENSLKAMHDLAAWSRDAENLKLVGITGSCGKTTTKDITASLLGSKFNVSKNIGNFNNIWGLPVSLLRRSPESNLYVCEMGMSYTGEMETIARIARPDVMVFTNIAPVHLQNFASLEEIAEAKAEAFAGMADSTPVVANADDPQVMRICQRSGNPLVTFGNAANADIRLVSATDRGINGADLEIEITGKTYKVSSPLPGLHNASNLLAAIGAGVALKILPEDLIAQIDNIELSPMRSSVLEFDKGFTVINDVYNSNPTALGATIEMLAASDGYQRKIAVLGDMLELGQMEKKMHWESGLDIAQQSVDYLITVGPLMVNCARGAEKAGLMPDNIYVCQTTQEALDILGSIVNKGDLVLAKGSRGVRMESIVAGLGEKFNYQQSGKSEV